MVDVVLDAFHTCAAMDEWFDSYGCDHIAAGATYDGTMELWTVRHDISEEDCFEWCNTRDENGLDSIGVHACNAASWTYDSTPNLRNCQVFYISVADWASGSMLMFEDVADGPTTKVFCRPDWCASTTQPAG